MRLASFLLPFLVRSCAVTTGDHAEFGMDRRRSHSLGSVKYASHVSGLVALLLACGRNPVESDTGHRPGKEVSNGGVGAESGTGGAGSEDGGSGTGAAGGSAGNAGSGGAAGSDAAGEGGAAGSGAAGGSGAGGSGTGGSGAGGSAGNGSGGDGGSTGGTSGNGGSGGGGPWYGSPVVAWAEDRWAVVYASQDNRSSRVALRFVSPTGELLADAVELPWRDRPFLPTDAVVDQKADSMGIVGDGFFFVHALTSAGMGSASWWGGCTVPRVDHVGGLFVFTSHRPATSSANAVSLFEMAGRRTADDIGSWYQNPIAELAQHDCAAQTFVATEVGRAAVLFRHSEGGGDELHFAWLEEPCPGCVTGDMLMTGERVLVERAEEGTPRDFRGLKLGYDGNQLVASFWEASTSELQFLFLSPTGEVLNILSEIRPAPPAASPVRTDGTRFIQAVVSDGEPRDLRLYAIDTQQGLTISDISQGWFETAHLAVAPNGSHAIVTESAPTFADIGKPGSRVELFGVKPTGEPFTVTVSPGG